MVVVGTGLEGALPSYLCLGYTLASDYSPKPLPSLPVSFLIISGATWLLITLPLPLYTESFNMSKVTSLILSSWSWLCSPLIVSLLEGLSAGLSPVEVCGHPQFAHLAPSSLGAAEILYDISPAKLGTPSGHSKLLSRFVTEAQRWLEASHLRCPAGESVDRAEQGVIS